MAESSSSSSTRQYTGDETKKTVLGDVNTMKRMIDDAVRRRLHLALLRPRSTPACPDQIIGVLLEDDSDFVEDVALSNFKLVVGFASVGASVVSHVYPAAFPKNWCAGGVRAPKTRKHTQADSRSARRARRHVLLLCCLWYFIGSGIL